MNALSKAAVTTIKNRKNNPIKTLIAPDVAVCDECLADTTDPFGRRYRYAFTTCTHCGPCFSVIETTPDNLASTNMNVSQHCNDCSEEYQTTTSRRFHQHSNGCYVCGPKIELARIDGGPVCMESLTQLDDVDAACSVLQNGDILAVKSTGGFYLACDATNDTAVKKLRDSTQQSLEPFALMARDTDVIKRYAMLTEQEEKLLHRAEAPIVILQKSTQPPPGNKKKFGVADGERANDLIAIVDNVAPGQNSLGFILPHTPMHHLMLKRMKRPIIFTPAKYLGEVQVTSNHEVKTRLNDIAEYVLWHDQDIVNQIDDSVIHVMHHEARLLKRARGYAPTARPLPEGFEHSPESLAMGSELNNTFCLIKNGSYVLSHHIGDLTNELTYKDYKKNISLYKRLYQHKPKTIIIDTHPDYLSSKLGKQLAADNSIPLQQVENYHAHIAACLVENNMPLKSEAVLAVVLGDLGLGEDGTHWGGEFFLCDYTHTERLGTFKPIAMLDATKEKTEPWRDAYAHLMAELGWPELKMNFDDLELMKFFANQSLSSFNDRLKNKENAPLASSCGRLFNAVAAAMGICRDTSSYKGQAASELEALVDQETLHLEDELLAYPFAIPQLTTTDVKKRLPYIEPLAMWQALLGDLILETPAPVMSARFHKGLAKIIVTMVKKLTTRDAQRVTNTIALSGELFQNKILFEQVVNRLEDEKFNVLTHKHIPTNGNGIALGQAVIGCARSLKNNNSQPCV
ncbi:MAG: carbamoyltransferase HypF [Gammaproteobacteria bacterium]|nr:carbamoyltransferase HypF [Gammaproteobacteria bacterium]